ncbi:winged helix-turn-helix domain-containing protein [Dankookia sp. P2]|uniref:winged helix-turn-helix domain-containing protein n=1 Tax=Dankookia sp. P2 TaxID=3423955 RepID=UPI003D6796FA
MERAKPELLHAGQDVLRFADFTLDSGRGALLRPDGTHIALRPKTAELLRHLAERAGHVVARDVLLEAVWPGVYVSEDSVTQCVAEIRRALGEAGNSLLKTLPKRGYMLDVKPHQEVAAPDDALPNRVKGETSPSSNKPSVVVLPFQNMSGDPEQEYFADGIVEEITTALSRIRWLFVIARNSAFIYKGRAVDVRQVGVNLAYDMFWKAASERKDGVYVSLRRWWKPKPGGTFGPIASMAHSMMFSDCRTRSPRLSRARSSQASDSPKRNFRYEKDQKI